MSRARSTFVKFGAPVLGTIISLPIGAAVFQGPAKADCVSVHCSDPPVNLGTIDNASGTSIALGVNADGSVVVGQSATKYSDAFGNALYHAFRSNPDGSLSDLGTLLDAQGSSIATGTNWDGSVIVGASATPFKDALDNALSHAFRWTSSEGMTDLGTVGNVIGNSRATGTNGDGSVVVGYSTAPTDANGSNYYHAFRWTHEGMIDLGTINSASGFSAAYATNGDGSVVVGESAIPKIDNAYFSHAFRWTPSGGMADLGTLGNVQGYSAATAVSVDGSVVVGQSTAQSGSGLSVVHAFRWTSASGMADLGTPAGDARNSRATGVSGDGTIVIGQYSASCIECGERPFRWTANGGMQDLNDLLASAGVLPSGQIIYSANAISKDGQFIVGSGKFDFRSSLHRALLGPNRGTDLWTDDHVLRRELNRRVVGVALVFDDLNSQRVCDAVGRQSADNDAIFCFRIWLRKRRGGRRIVAAFERAPQHPWRIGLP